MASRAQRPRRRSTVPAAPRLDPSELAKIDAALRAYLAEAGFPEERGEWDPEPGCESFVRWLHDNGSGPPRRRITAARRRTISDAGRARIAAAQRRRWAQRRPPASEAEAA